MGVPMRALLLAVVLVAFAALSAFALAQDEPAAPTITWRTDLAAARADAAEQGRPLMVVFR